jgi:hypothetical protein
MMSLRLVQSCYACPEQYDAYHGDQIVAYLRLRHGRFTVECPDIGGTLVYEAHPEGDGIFVDDERSFYLGHASAAILAWIEEQKNQGNIFNPAEIE